MGVKIVTPRGNIFGSLCAFDHNYYQYRDQDVALLKSLAIFFANVLELEETAKSLQEAEQSNIDLLEEKANLLAVTFTQIHVADSTESDTGTGTGLGLYISKQLVELMNGRIWLEQSSSSGACFSCEITLSI
ncbi:ATP-binding protein [Paenibacillus sp. WQ 127069]|uniref:histidine kinase n=1 Tax=Paenibacillus baimaensis TaxID=2982185 RepID=A0ABT2UNS7_9BACL|nr:ATP-binding protein [Paenibacillus sp. WQ 127069]MCU6795507.1 ATP-binding protein [Paenibacillus sp. WQ 127069]